MSRCTDIKPLNACFIPNDPLVDKVPILIHVIYDNDEVAVGQAYTTVSDVETPIDPSTYLGGGVVVNGACTQSQGVCKKSKTLYTVLDNTRTRFTWNMDLLVTFTDGSTATVSQTPTTGWTQQLNQWVTLFSDLLDSKCSVDYLVEARCNILPGGCGGLLPPPSELEGRIPTMYARYLQIGACSTCPAINNVEITSINGTILEKPRPLVMDYIEGEEQRYVWCQNCGQEGTLYFEDGTEVPEADLPLCLFECAEEFPQTPEPACSFELVPICDSDQPNGVNTEAFIQFADCGDGQVLNAFLFVDADGGLEEYTPNEGSIGPCGTELSSSIQCDSCGNQIEVVLYDDGTTLYYSYSEKGGRGELTFPVGELGKCDNVLCDTCEDCSDEEPASGQVTTLPYEAIAKSGSTNPGPTTIEGALNTTTDISGLLAGANSNGPATGNEDWLTRFDLSNLAPDCAVISSLNLEIDSEPTSGGFAILIYDGNDPSTEIYSTIVGGDGWTYHQFNGSSNILFGGHDFVPANPNPQPGSGSYTTTTPIDLSTLPADLSNITVATIVITGGEFTSAVRLIADIDSSACSEPQEKFSKRVVIDPTCQNKLGDIPVVVNNQEPIRVVIEEPTSTEVTTSSTVCYPDDDSSNIVLEYTQVIELPSSTVINSYYTVIALGTGTISAGLNVGDQYVPADALLLGNCPTGSVPTTENVDRVFCDVDGNQVICRETFDISVGPIGSGNEVSLFTVYYDSTGAIITFDPITDAFPCPVPCDCVQVLEHYLCIDGQKVPVWVQINKEDLSINSVINTLTLQQVPLSAYQDGFVDPCADCGIVACMQFDGFDGQMTQDLSDPDLSGSFDVGDTSLFDVTINGTTTTVVLDYLASSDNVNQSTWYTDLTNFINSNSNFTISVVQDVNVEDNGKVLWQIDYSGPGNETLEIVKNSGDIYTFSVDSSGVFTVTITDDQGDVFDTASIIQSCE